MAHSQLVVTTLPAAPALVTNDYGVNKPLPLGLPVAVTFTPTATGPIRYSCAVNMVAGELAE
ncbi:MAG TPA: hypothetical protein VNG33_19525 [Polyangiaceae bacterium]|nr:hypothetical protein [Polyangiaceae bacterium]